MILGVVTYFEMKFTDDLKIAWQDSDFVFKVSKPQKRKKNDYGPLKKVR